MTVIAGIICRDGIVVASDSQESDAEQMKRLGVRKIYDTKVFGFNDVEIVVAGTGSSAYIARAAELIKQNGYAPHFIFPREVADIAEKSLGQMKQRYGEDLDVELLLAVWCKNTPQTDVEGDRPPAIGLYNVYPPEEKEILGVAEPVSDYSALGSGGLFARYLLNRFHGENGPTQNLSINAAVREAVYVVEEAKKVDLYCGGETHVAVIRPNKPVEIKSRDEIKRIVSQLDGADKTIKQNQQEMMARKITIEKSRK